MFRVCGPSTTFCTHSLVTVQAEAENDAQNKDHNVGSANRFKTPATCNPAPSTIGCESAAGSALSSAKPFLPFSFANMAPPKPDDSGAAIGIPVPLQAMRRCSNTGSTLPPMPSDTRWPSAPPPMDVSPPATPPLSGSNVTHPARSGQHLQYRRVFVPSTVIHSGVAQQMLVPMMCVVAGSGKPASAPLHSSPLAQRAMQHGTAAQRKGTPASGTTHTQRRREQEALKPIGPAYVPLRKASRQSRYSTRSSKLASSHKARSSVGHFNAAADGSESEQDTQPSDMGALNMLADAALLELC
jgi:hypothetical protein